MLDLQSHAPVGNRAHAEGPAGPTFVPGTILRLLRRPGPLLFALLAALALLPAVTPHAAEARSTPSLFGSREVRSPDLEPFPKWRGVLERTFNDENSRRGCSSGLFSKCPLDEWREFLDAQKGRGLMARLEAVNTYMNEHPYVIDPINWGVRDYWASPVQFLKKDGDCEDYAIAKFVSLRKLGVANDRMRIVVLHDMNLNTPHAVLVVYVGERAIVLDNQIEDLVSARTIRHYRPIYSVNEDAWWLHRR